MQKTDCKKQKETFFSWMWRKTHKDNLPPPYYCYSTIPFSNLRVQCYRYCGYKIGKKTFIGMRCYLDDMCYDMIDIGDNVTISYGVFFACHGRNQGHNKLIIKNGAYIGMNSSIVARSDKGLVIGENAVVGACSLVNKSVADNSVVVGVPAKEISKIQ